MKRVALAVDVGGSKLMVGLVDETGVVLHSQRYVWQSLTHDGVLGTIMQACTAMVTEHANIQLSAVGVNVPGLADKSTGMWVTASYTGISNVPIARLMTETFKLPTYIDNDVNNCALAEKIFGCCKQCTDFIWLTVSNGCGGALFLNDKLFMGAYGYAGELGHIVVEDEGGLTCGCGHFGCLEAQASGRGIVERYLKRCGSKEHIGSITAEDIARFARENDQVAKDVYTLEGIYIGKACAAVINAINPQKLVIGGGVSASFDLFEKPLKETIKQQTYIDANKNVSVERTALKEWAPLIGAATCAFVGDGILQA